MNATDRMLRIGPANTRVEFSVRWLGVVMVRGHFRDVDGALRVPDGMVESAEVAVDVASSSVTTGIVLRDRHLRGPRFLDAALHPVISFRSTRVERPNGALVISGALTLRGVPHELGVVAPLHCARGAGLNSMLSLVAEFDLPRAPFGVGIVHGLQRLNPLFLAIGASVHARVEILVPAARLLPALLPALGR